MARVDTQLKSASRDATKALRVLSFAAPVTHVYNPLDYAWNSHKRYIERFANSTKEVLFLGMNPGPFGMAQTGVPFGEVSLVRDWMGINEKVGKPKQEHPKRPIQGFDCTRSEVSGQRLWGWARDRFEAPERFFERFYVHNYCPLAFMAETGRNITPDKLPLNERTPLFAICDQFLLRVVQALKPKMVVGVGVFAENRAALALREEQLHIGRMPHPSPASPAANAGWAQLADKALAELNIQLPNN